MLQNKGRTQCVPEKTLKRLVTVTKHQALQIRCPHCFRCSCSFCRCPCPVLPLLALCSSCIVVAGVDAAVGGADVAAMCLLFCSSVMWFLCLLVPSLVCRLFCLFHVFLWFSVIVCFFPRRLLADVSCFSLLVSSSNSSFVLSLVPSFSLYSCFLSNCSLNSSFIVMLCFTVYLFFVCLCHAYVL